MVQAEQRAGPPGGPAALGDGVIDQVEQAGLDGGVHAGRDRASGQSQRDFPWYMCRATACSVTVARSRSISLRTSASSATWADCHGRPGTDADSASSAPWPDMVGLDYRDTVTDFEMPAGTFFDIAVVHLLTTATIDRLRALYPQGRFEARRFRPNIVISTPEKDQGFVENGWVGRTVTIGGNVRLAITEPCPRCVMITLPQGDLPKDSGILRTAAQHNGVNVGVYASVLSGGTIRRGDAVSLA